MKPILRATTSEDRPRLTAFLAKAFAAPANAAFLEAGLMDWKYWYPRADYPHPRGFVLEREGNIVAHAGLWPGTTAQDAGCRRGAHMIDWASDPAAPGSGLALVRRLLEQFDFLYSIGGSAMTQQVLPAFGFQQVGAVWTAARPLAPFRQLAAHPRKNWKSPARLLRNLWWAAMPTAGSLPGWSVERLPLSVDGATPDGMPDRFPRSADFFRYLSACPGVSIALFRLLRDGQSQGTLALSVIRGQARIAGMWMKSTSDESTEAAYRLAQAAPRRLGAEENESTAVCELSAAGSTAQSERGAQAAGLRMLSHTPVFLFSKPGQGPPMPFEFQLCDNDAVFWSEGVPDFLT